MIKKKKFAALVWVYASFIFVALFGKLSFALTLYRYVDAYGRIIVVDSLEKVPEDRRFTVKSEVIGPPRREKARDKKSSEEPKSSLVASSSFNTPTASASAVQDLSKPSVHTDTALGSEKLDVEHASATLWLGELSKILERTEEIWHTADSFGMYHRRLLVLQEDNLVALERLRQFEHMTWKGHEEWVRQARDVTEQFRQLAFTMSIWIRQASKQLIMDLPPLVTRLRAVFEMLAQALPPEKSAKRQSATN